MSYMIDSMMAQVIDSNKAKEITRYFLAQNHSVLDVRNPTLEDASFSMYLDSLNVVCSK